MNRPIRKFFALSFALHAAFFLLSGFVLVRPDSAARPIKVRLLERIVPANEKMMTGRIEDLPEPEEKKTPGRADILARFDSAARSPEKGVVHQADTTAIPREKIDPPAPSKTKSEDDQPAAKPAEPKTRIAALIEPKPETVEKPASSLVEVFSPDVTKTAPETEPSSTFVQDEKEKEEARRTLSAKITDRPAAEPKEPIRPSGMIGAKGSELDKYAMTTTDEVIDMGDEAVVSLSTRAFMYTEYFESIREAVEDVWTYPEEAIVKGWSGRLMLRFSLKNTGELIDVRIVQSTGYKILDHEATMAVSQASPYLPFPPTLNKKRLHIVATFEYEPTFNAIR